MRAWIKAPGMVPHTVIIPNELKMLQQLVDGYIECVTISPELVIICDEEGLLKQKAYNCTIDGMPYVGTIVAVSVNGDEFDSIGDDAVKFLNEEVKA